MKANNAIMIRIIVIHALILAANFCWPSAPLSPQSGSRVGGLNMNPSGYASGNVSALTVAEGLTNLYSSITAKPRMILSIIRDQNQNISILYFALVCLLFPFGYYVFHDSH